MKKENFGVPATLLVVLAYVLGYQTSFLALVILLVGAFALGFDSRVKKACVQSIGLSLIGYAVATLFDLFSTLFGVKIWSSLSLKEIFDLTAGDLAFTFLNQLVSLTMLVLFSILVVTALCKKDIILAPVHKAVDGFVPMKQYAQQPYGQPQQFNGQPQQFNGQPQQFNGQPQQFNGQPQQFNGQPQQFNGQPQQFNHPNNGQ